MNCQQANQIDMVDYLASLGYNPNKIIRDDYWYLSPLHEERTASFKVNRGRNIWFDHGTGQGGNLVDFATHFFKCELAEVLSKIKSGSRTAPNSIKTESFRLTAEPANTIQIIRVDEAIKDLFLLRYLSHRAIDQTVAQNFCKQVLYENAGKRFTAIGFKNNCGGYELRSENFKGSSSPKYVSWLNNRADNITVFEGFFDFLTWRSINTPRQANSTNILVLNSLSFFTRSLLLQEKHQRIHLYLDNDVAGKKCVMEVQKRNHVKVIDESRLYRDFKDLNDWHINSNRSRHIGKSIRIGR